MTEQQKELLRRILNSRHFASAESLRKILEYLCRQADDPEQSGLKEYDIAIHALGRSSSFDSKTDPIVRVNIATIRERLQSFFSNEAADSRIRLVIPKGQYRAVFEEIPRPPNRRNVLKYPALEQFWRPHLVPQYPNSLVFTELLFFRDAHGTYLRNIYVNELQGGLDRLHERLPCLDAKGFRPSFHFVSAGEVHCMLALTRMLERMGVGCQVKNSRFLAWNQLRGSNLILIGSSRTNPFIDSLQGENNFLLGPDRIINVSPQAGEESVYCGTRADYGKLEKVTEYALVTRRPAVTSGCVVTSIAGNHGRAIEGAGDFLTDESQLGPLVRRLIPDSSQDLPSHFQVLLRVEMVDFDEEVAKVEVIATRVVAG